MLLALAKPSIALQSRAMADDAIPVGASKIGGAPDAPADFTWPLRQPTAYGQAEMARLRASDVEGQNEHLWREIALKEMLAKRIAPLAFMMQVDLAACAAMGPLEADMPRTGHFLVFYDLVFNPERGQEADGTPLFQLIYIDDRQLVRHQPPDLGYPLFGGIEAYRNRLPSARLMPIFTYTLPDQRAAPITPSYLNRLYPHESWSELRPTHLNASNRLGGWPENIKREMTIDLAARDAGVDISKMRYRDVFDRFDASAREWVLLLQMGAYDNDINDFNGLYYIWIRRKHLQAREFAKARLVYQKDY